MVKTSNSQCHSGQHHHYSGLQWSTLPLQWVTVVNTTTTVGHSGPRQSLTVSQWPRQSLTVSQWQKPPLQWVTVAETTTTVGNSGRPSTRTSTTGTHHVPHRPRYPITPGTPPTTPCTTTPCTPPPWCITEWVLMSKMTKLVPNGCLIKPLSAYKREPGTCYVRLSGLLTVRVTDCPGY